MRMPFRGFWVFFVVLVAACGQLHAATGKVTLATPAVGGGIAIEQEAAESFTKATGVDVEIRILQSATYEDQLITLFAAGSPPDVLYSAARNIGQLFQAGIVQPLDPFMARSRDFDIRDFFPTIVRAFTIDNRIYGVPRGNQPFVMYVSRTIFEESGVSLPTPNWTWERQFLDIARRLTKDADGDGIPEVYGFNDVGTEWWWPLVWSFGGGFLDPAEKSYTLNQPAGVAALRFMTSLSQVERVAPGPLVGLGGVMPAFVNKKAAMFSSDAVVGAQPGMQEAPLNWEVEEIPVGPAGRQTRLDGAGYSLSSQARQPELAWEFLKALTSEAGIKSLTRAFRPGQVVPSRRTVALGEDFLRAPAPPASRMPFIRALDYARAPYVGKEKWTELRQILMSQTINPLHRGDVDVVAAVDRIAPAIEAVLRQQ